MQLKLDRKGLGTGQESQFSQSSITRVILVRHGQSTYNAQKRYQGSCDDSVLTEKGHSDAYRTGVALKTIKLDAVYTSPLRRTQETTAEILGE